MSAIRGFRGARLTTLSLLLCLVFCAVLAPTVSAFSDGSRSGIDAKIAARLSDEQTDLTLAQIFKDRLGSVRLAIITTKSCILDAITCGIHDYVTFNLLCPVFGCL